MLSSMSRLYILEINPLSVASFANIFSYFEGCLFVLFMVSFAVQEPFVHTTRPLRWAPGRARREGCAEEKTKG